jgi:hypothetical protein
MKTDVNIPSKRVISKKNFKNFGTTQLEPKFASVEFLY